MAVIFTDEQIERYSKVVDGAVDFTKFNIKFKFLYLFNIDLGKILENCDDKLVTKILTLVNKLASAGTISDDVTELIKAIFENIDSADETNLTKVIIDFIMDKADSLGDTTKTTISAISVTLVAQFGDFLDKLNKEFDALELKAE